MQSEVRQELDGCSDAARYNRRIEVSWEYSSSNSSGWLPLTDVGTLQDTW